MSTTTIQAVEIVYQHLLGSVLFTDAKKPTGNLYRYQRPDGSGAEDVVVNSIMLNRRSVQEGVLNVNLFVPNKVLQLATGTDRSQPNHKRLSEISELANTVLNEVWGTGYMFEVQQDNMIPDENNQHFLNFRLNFKALNIT